MEGNEFQLCDLEVPPPPPVLERATAMARRAFPGGRRLSSRLLRCPERSLLILSLGDGETEALAWVGQRCRASISLWFAPPPRADCRRILPSQMPRYRPRVEREGCLEMLLLPPTPGFPGSRALRPTGELTVIK